MIKKKVMFPALPHSWSELTWQQLCDCWQVKIRYGGNADVARVAGLLSLLGCSVCKSAVAVSNSTGENLYRLRDTDGCQWTVTAREASQMASQALPWFDYPYGDPGEKEVTDDKGKIVKPRREPVSGYVSQMRDALIIPDETVVLRRRHFYLPQVACNNLTWQQYRILQDLTPSLFDENAGDAVVDIQAKFLAHCLVPRSVALLDTDGGSIRIRPHYQYRYDTERADGFVAWWRRRLLEEHGGRCEAAILFHVCFQAFQTALAYYASAYPLLFGGGSKDTVRDALQGEVGTINAIMMKASYTNQQEVYDSNLPFILDILNTMAKEAKEIERMNAKIKKK